MPNWCDNRLYIRGDINTLKGFIQQVLNTEEQAQKRGQSYDILGNLYPTPEELNIMSGSMSKDDPEYAEWEAKREANRAKYGVTDWYDWNCRNWGTKWGDDSTILLTEEPFVHPDGTATIEFGFATAWSPAIEGIAHIATLFPTLEFALSYSELGMGYFGFTTFDSTGDYLDNCEQVEDIDGYNDIDHDDEDSWESVMNLVAETRDRLLEHSGW